MGNRGGMVPGEPVGPRRPEQGPFYLGQGQSLQQPSIQPQDLHTGDISGNRRSLSSGTDPFHIEGSSQSGINVEQIRAGSQERVKTISDTPLQDHLKQIGEIYSPLVDDVYDQQTEILGILPVEVNIDLDLRVEAGRYKRNSPIRREYMLLEELDADLIGEVATVLQRDSDEALQRTDGQTRRKIHHESIQLSYANVESFNLSQGDEENQTKIQQWLWQEHPELRMTEQHIPVVRYIAFGQIINRLHLKPGDTFKTQLHMYIHPSTFLADYLKNMENFESHFFKNEPFISELAQDTLVGQIASNMIRRDMDFLASKRKRRIRGRSPQIDSAPMDLNTRLSFTLDYMLGGRYTKFNLFKELFADMRTFVMAGIQNRTLDFKTRSNIARLIEARYKHPQTKGIDKEELAYIYKMLDYY